jgi:hypothetical protein
MALVLITGLLSWATENLMFAMATVKGVQTSDSTFSRPYLFFSTSIIASTWAFLFISVVVGAGLWLVLEMVPKPRQRNHENHNHFRLDHERGTHVEMLDQRILSAARSEYYNTRVQRAEQIGRKMAQDNVSMKWLAWTTMF